MIAPSELVAALNVLCEREDVRKLLELLIEQRVTVPEGFEHPTLTWQERKLGLGLLGVLNGLREPPAEDGPAPPLVSANYRPDPQGIIRNAHGGRLSLVNFRLLRSGAGPQPESEPGPKAPSSRLAETLYEAAEWAVVGVASCPEGPT